MSEVTARLVSLRDRVENPADRAAIADAVNALDMVDDTIDKINKRLAEGGHCSPLFLDAIRESLGFEADHD